ncbi:hypothetical protein CCE01nite_32470 [Cellulomonas cellasea]|uniref:Uncharacterized protein n=1 Tax=Cellulomonas cellasea TaxID=43670 RepID=A0A4Y3L362_9CELL|nr:hypothetical protein CCE01nite_32470 [Cellulomonas cellasea]
MWSPAVRARSRAALPDGAAWPRAGVPLLRGPGRPVARGLVGLPSAASRETVERVRRVGVRLAGADAPAPPGPEPLPVSPPVRAPEDVTARRTASSTRTHVRPRTRQPYGVARTARNAPDAWRR